MQDSSRHVGAIADEPFPRFVLCVVVVVALVRTRLRSQRPRPKHAKHPLFNRNKGPPETKADRHNVVTWTSLSRESATLPGVQRGTPPTARRSPPRPAFYRQFGAV